MGLDFRGRFKRSGHSFRSSSSTFQHTLKIKSFLPLPLFVCLLGHEDRTWSVAWNPIQPLLATCSSDKTVRLYHYRSLNNTSNGLNSSSSTSFAASSTATPPPFDFTFATSIATGHSRTVRNVAWSPSGRSLATASFDSSVAIFERSHEEGDEDIYENEDDDEDGEGGTKGGRRREAPPTGEWECASTLEGHESECKSVAYSYNGGLLASCSRDKSVWIWEGMSPSVSFCFVFFVWCFEAMNSLQKKKN